MAQFEELLKRAKAGDKTARDSLVEENTGLVWSIVRRFSHRGYDVEDLFQIGIIGMIKAIDYFDLSYDVRFSTYAVPMIAGEIKRYLRDDGMIKVSRMMKDYAYRIHQFKASWQGKEGREPTLGEISQGTGITIEDIMTAQEASQEVTSLYKTIYERDGSEIYLMDHIDSGKAEDQQIIDRILVAQLLEQLTPKEKVLIVLRYYGNQSQTQIAGMLGVSQVQVSRMEKKILKKLREKIL